MKVYPKHFQKYKENPASPSLKRILTNEAKPLVALMLRKYNNVSFILSDSMKKDPLKGDHLQYKKSSSYTLA